MSTEVVWVNRNLAVIARLYRIRNVQPVWNKHADGTYKVTLQSGERGVSAVFDADELTAAFKGSETAQSTVIRNLTQIVRSLAA
jgi:hypothetical protein